jgi:hypothetical protein
VSREDHLYEKWLGWLDRIDNDLTDLTQLALETASSMSVLARSPTRPTYRLRTCSRRSEIGTSARRRSRTLNSPAYSLLSRMRTEKCEEVVLRDAR